MPSALELTIAKTVAWFSLFETPVTVFEIWKWMLEPERPYALEEVYAALEGEWLRARLQFQDGFIAIPRLAKNDPRLSLGALVSARRERFLDAVRKFGKLRRASRYFAALPCVESVSAGNTLAWWNTRPDSDIDLFVVTRPGTIWLSRLLMVAPFALLGKRPGASSVDPFCFSFFVASDAVDVSSFRLPGGDPYLSYWTRSLVPIFRRSAPRFRVPTPVVGMLERAAKWIQLRRLPARIRGMMNRDSRVIVTDFVLKFHDNDRRAEYRDKYNALCSEIVSPTSSFS